MSQSREIKRRIRSIQSTKKITKAMELVSASKMRKAVNQVLISRHYSNYAWNIIQSIAKSNPKYKHPLLQKPKKVTKAAILVISSNRGLCGGFNSNVLKETLKTVKNLQSQNISFDFITFGKKTRDQLRRLKYNIIADFSKPDLLNDVTAISSLSHLLLEEYSKKNYQRIILIYTDFISSLKQHPLTKELLPLKTYEDKDLGTVGNISDSEKKPEIIINSEYKFEPSPKKVLDQILPRILEIQIYQAVLESDASEHSSRMMAMKNATTSASDMIDSLSLAYNQARQAAITQELAEIVSGASAL